jgi:hypothetical protein
VQADLRLICPSRPGCWPLNRWADCHLALAASHAYVAGPAWAASPLGQRTIDFLGTLNASFVAASRSLEPATPNMLFSNAAASVRRLDDPNDFVAFFGQESMDAFDTIRKLQASILKSR